MKNRKKILNTLWTCLCILIGNALLAFLVAAFVIPHGIIVGGTTGISILLARAIPLDPSLFVLALNAVLLLLGLVILGKKLFLTSVASSILYPIMLWIAERIPGIDSLTDNTLLAVLFAGTLLGIALGVVMRVGASTGGIDIINLILHKWFHLPVSVFVYLVDIIILAGQIFLAPPEGTLYAILFLVIETLVLEQVMILGKSQIQLFVVTEHYEELRQKLLVELEAGVTMTLIETGALRKEQKALLCVIPPRKLHTATHMICSLDPSAFITVTKIKEVRGQGFTLERRATELLENIEKK